MSVNKLVHRYRPRETFDAAMMVHMEEIQERKRLQRELQRVTEERDQLKKLLTEK